MSFPMFTGLVEAAGRLTRRAPRTGGGCAIVVVHPLGRLEPGESVAVSGICLTATSADDAGFRADVSSETLARTTLGRLPEDAPVNLERALRVGDRLGGHWVTGHVDATCEVAELRPAGDSLFVRVELPRELAPYVAAKGSVALDGVSLTVNGVDGDGFDFMLIPHTRRVTTLGAVAVGTTLNLEVDILSRYVARWGSDEARRGGEHDGVTKGAPP